MLYARENLIWFAKSSEKHVQQLFAFQTKSYMGPEIWTLIALVETDLPSLTAAVVAPKQPKQRPTSLNLLLHCYENGFKNVFSSMTLSLRTRRMDDQRAKTFRPLKSIVPDFFLSGPLFLLA